MSEYRKKLAKLTSKERFRFFGTFKYSGYKDSYNPKAFGPSYVPTFMLKDVKYYNEEKDSWDYVADHLWMNYTKSFKYFFPLREGDKIYFNGRITPYTSKKGENVRIERPTQIKVFRGEEELQKDEKNILKDYEMVQIFDEENKDYYTARDEILAAFWIPYYYFARNNYPQIDSYILADDSWISQTDYKRKYVDREDIVDFYQRLTKPIEVKLEYYDKEKKKRVKVEKEEIIEAAEADRKSRFWWDDDEWY